MEYEKLLAAVLALDPLDSRFILRRTGGIEECNICGSYSSIEVFEHTPECPVTLLRNILNEDPQYCVITTSGPAPTEAYVSACDTAASILKADMQTTSHIKSPTDNGV